MFDWIQFRRAGWKTIDMQTRMGVNKRLDFLPIVNRRIVPDQHNRTQDLLQKMPQEIEYLFTGHIALVQSRAQLEPPCFWRDQ